MSSSEVDMQIVSPRKGHYLDLGLFVFALTGEMILFLYSGYEFVSGDRVIAQQVLVGAIVALVAPLALSRRPGRFVAISRDRQAVSRPTLFRPRPAALISLRHIQNYKRIGSVTDRERLVGLFVLTSDGRRFRYYDSRTPNSVGILLEVFAQGKVKEDTIGKQLLG